jgi:hypothetical protein
VSTRLLISTGELLEVDGSIPEVEKRLEDASRSTSGTLAWLTDVATGEPVGINPTHVVTLRPGDA